MLQQKHFHSLTPTDLQCLESSPALPYFSALRHAVLLTEVPCPFWPSLHPSQHISRLGQLKCWCLSEHLTSGKWWWIVWCMWKESCYQVLMEEVINSQPAKTCEKFYEMLHGMTGNVGLRTSQRHYLTEKMMPSCCELLSSLDILLPKVFRLWWLLWRLFLIR